MTNRTELIIQDVLTEYDKDYFMILFNCDESGFYDDIPAKHISPIRKLLWAVFVDETFSVAVEGGINFHDIKDYPFYSITSSFRHDISDKDCIIAPCNLFYDLGNFWFPFVEYSRENNILALYAQLKYYVKSINFYDTTLVSVFFRNFRMDNPVKFLRLPDGGALTVKKAIEYLHRKEATKC